MKRLLLSFVLCSLFLAAAAEAQRGFRGGWGGEVGAPPKFPQVADFDGSWHFCRLMYRSVRAQQRGLGWGTDYPNADINFSIRLSELTKTQVGLQGGRERDPNHLVVRPTDPELFQCPFVMASDPGSAGFSPEDAEGLRNYLLKGGFLWADDFWGPWAWEAFIGEIAKALPPGEYPVKEITAEHPIYRVLFPVAKIPQVPSMQFWRMSGGSTSEMDEYSTTAHMAASVDKQGRIMVLMTHNTDIADSWEREADDPEFFFNFSPNGYAVGLNAVLYSMSH
jgi:hypothetical protein